MVSQKQLFQYKNLKSSKHSTAILFNFEKFYPFLKNIT